MSTDQEKQAEAEAKANTTLKTIEEVKSYRKEDPKTFRESLKQYAIYRALVWFFRWGGSPE